MRYKAFVDAANAPGQETVRDRVRYWLELSDYDLLTAKAMLCTRRCRSMLRETAGILTWLKSRL